MLTVDGSFGEGGGQILRTSLALSLVTGTPFRIDRIRAKRAKPGLMRQHLTCVKAAAEVGHAQTAGAAIGSVRLDFVPGKVTPGDYRFAIGSAGSTTLVLQTVLPPLLLADSPSRLVLEGGTHNMNAPPFDFLAKTFVPILNRMGPQVTAVLVRPGFYPAGKGRIEITINPVRSLRLVELQERGPIRRRAVRAVVAGLPRHIAEREARTLIKSLDWDEVDAVIDELPPECGPGNVVMAEIDSEHITEVITGFGERGVRAEEVARRAAGEVRRYLEAGAPIGEHLADQLLLLCALAGGGAYKTGTLTEHTRTNMAVIRMFLDVGIVVEETDATQRLICVSSAEPG